MIDEGPCTGLPEEDSLKFNLFEREDGAWVIQLTWPDELGAHSGAGESIWLRSFESEDHAESIAHLMKLAFAMGCRH